MTVSFASRLRMNCTSLALVRRKKTTLMLTKKLTC